MFERFSDGARRGVVLAQEEARRLKHNYIGTEHILLGVVAGGTGVAAQALTSMGVTLDKVRAEVEAMVGVGDSIPRGNIPFTRSAKKVLELSLREALQLGHNYIGTEHVVLGLLREGKGAGAEVLARLDVDRDSLRERVVMAMTEVPPEPAERVLITPAAEEARTAGVGVAFHHGHERMGTDHLLFALLSAPESGAVKFLHTEGINIAGLKTRLERALEEADDSTDP